MFKNINGNEIDFETLRIESDRLFLRPITMDDAQIMFEHFTPEITRYMTPSSPKKVEETKDFLRETIKKRAHYIEITFAICHCQTSEFLGVCGLHEIGSSHPELGIWLKKSAHGNHFGREAITALVAWTQRHIQHDDLIYPVDRNNIASRKIPESLGGEIFEERVDNKIDGGTLDLVIYKIPNQTQE